jgi:hypothetical protein
MPRHSAHHTAASTRLLSQPPIPAATPALRDRITLREREMRLRLCLAWPPRREAFPQRVRLVRQEPRFYRCAAPKHAMPIRLFRDGQLRRRPEHGTVAAAHIVKATQPRRPVSRVLTSDKELHRCRCPRDADVTCVAGYQSAAVMRSRRMMPPKRSDGPDPPLASRTRRLKAFDDGHAIRSSRFPQASSVAWQGLGSGPINRLKRRGEV